METSNTEELNGPLVMDLQSPSSLFAADTPSSTEVVSDSFRQLYDNPDSDNPARKRASRIEEDQNKTEGANEAEAERTKSKRKSANPRKLLRIRIKNKQSEDGVIVTVNVPQGEIYELVPSETECKVSPEESVERAARPRRRRTCKPEIFATDSAATSPEKAPPQPKSPRHRIRKRTLKKVDTPFFCDGCKKRFATEANLQKHKQDFCGRPKPTFECDVCQRHLSSKQTLWVHKRIHSEEKQFQCKICGKAFHQQSNLINHIKSHTASYQCELCGICYKTKISIDLHKERVHQGVHKTFPCSICGKAFTRKTKLKDHMNWHMGQSPHLCEHCGRRFQSRNILKKHMMIHEDRKPYQCTFCGKAFRESAVLKRHITTHTGIKPFRCNDCGKQFIHRVYLVRHKCPEAPKLDACNDVATPQCATVTAAEFNSVMAAAGEAAASGPIGGIDFSSPVF